MQLEITHFTDPACPFAFSAEPVRRRLQWHYGEQLRWRTRMIVLTLEPGEAEKLAEGAPGLQRTYGMPIEPAPYARPASSEPACRAVVAARVNAPDAEDTLLRRLRVHAMAGGLLDDPALIETAEREAGLDPGELRRWCASDAVEDALRADIAASRSPSAAARALAHKLGGPVGQRRYTAPSYEIRHPERGWSIVIPGFNPIQAYEVAIAGLAPELVRRPAPATVPELLAWGGHRVSEDDEDEDEHDHPHHPAEDRVVGPPVDVSERAHRASVRSRSFSSAVRRMRETCIWETPISAAIWVWVRSPAKRSSSTRRSRGER